LCEEKVEVRAERAHVDRAVRHGLGAVDEHHGAVRMGGLNDAFDRQHRAERVGDVRHGHQARARRQQLRERIELEFTAAVDGRHLERAAGLLAHHLPGDDVGVVLECGDEDLIAGAEAWPRVRLRDQIDALGGAAREDDLARRAGIDEAAHTLARTLERGRRRLAQGMHAAVHVGVRVHLVVVHRADHLQRALRGGGAVQVHQGMPVHAGAEDGKVAPHALDVERGQGGSAGGVRGHYSNSLRVASCRTPARFSSIWRRSSGTSMLANASARKAHFSRRCAVSRSSPRDSR
jgi:hypothetical protein